MVDKLKQINWHSIPENFELCAVHLELDRFEFFSFLVIG